MRRFSTIQRARLRDCDPHGRVRLDSIVRWIGDAASDDVADAGLTAADGVWVVRRTVIEVDDWPVLGREYRLTTWASAARGSSATRRTDVGAAVRATATWVALHPATMRPQRLTPRFLEVYGSSIGEARAEVKRAHPDPRSEPALPPRPWVVRYTDLDRVGHVNNAAYLEVVEDLFRGVDVPRHVDIEYRGGLSGKEPVTLLMGDGLLWFLEGGAVAASIRL